LRVHINQTAQYALRALMHLAALPAGSRVRARDLSRATGVPPAYLSKIMRRLTARRLLHAIKGHHGGPSGAPASNRLSGAGGLGNLGVIGACSATAAATSSRAPCTTPGPGSATRSTPGRGGRRSSISLPANGARAAVAVSPAPERRSMLRTRSRSMTR
jgi:hypothetical protein